MKRREFITKGSLLTAGVLTAGSVVKGLANNLEEKPIKVALIGSGKRGRHLLRTIKNTKGSVDIVALCDVRDASLKEGLKNVSSGTPTYKNHKDLLKQAKPDAVIIATPYSTHQAIAMDAVNLGIHVYCEKTMAKGLDEIDALVKNVEKQGVIFQTGHQYHSSKLYSEIIKMINQGQIGKVLTLNCKWFRKGDWRRTVDNPAEERLINWRMYREYSGGLTAELSAHQIDFANWLLGETPEQIIGFGGNDIWDDGRETFDNTNLVFKYPSGVKANFRCLTSNAPGGYEIEIIGDKGMLSIATETAEILYYEPYEKSELKEVDGVSGATPDFKAKQWKKIKVENIKPTKQALIDFKSSLKNNTQPLCNVRTGANTAIAVQMAVDAMLTGKTQHMKTKYQY